MNDEHQDGNTTVTTGEIDGIFAGTDNEEQSADVTDAQQVVEQTDTTTTSTDLVETKPAKAPLKRIATAVDAYENFDGMWRVAKALAVASGNGSDEAASKKIAAMLAGAEMGLPPAESARTIHVVPNKQGGSSTIIMSVAYLRVLKMQGWAYEFNYTGDGDSLSCECVLTERATGEQVRASFGIQDAKQLGYLDGWKKRSQLPRVMIKYRAIGYAAREAAIGGMSSVYMREEMDDSFIDVEARTVSSTTVSIDELGGDE